MFSGIIEESAQIIELTPVGAGAHLSLSTKLDLSTTELGDSIAIDGVCLTVVKIDGQNLSFDLAEETLRATALGSLSKGSLVNIERSLKLGSRLHGHFVFGHVDSVAELKTKTDEGNSVRLEFSVPSELLKYLAPKGSVSISGVSLTVGEVLEDSFTVYIIPHTGEVTTLLSKEPGSQLNIEIDMLARYVHRLISAEETAPSGINSEFLKENGFI